MRMYRQLNSKNTGNGTTKSLHFSFILNNYDIPYLLVIVRVRDFATIFTKNPTDTIPQLHPNDRTRKIYITNLEAFDPSRGPKFKNNFHELGLFIPRVFIYSY